MPMVLIEKRMGGGEERKRQREGEREGEKRENERERRGEAVGCREAVGRGTHLISM